MNIDFKSTLPKSYWIASTAETSFPTLENDIDVDIAIVGGGMTGILCAYQLHKQGLKVAILESSKILNNTTSHTTAKITSQHDLFYYKLLNSMGEKLTKQYAEANESAIKDIQNIVEANNIDCGYSTQDAYVYTQQDDYINKIKDEVQAASTLGIKATFLDEIPLPLKIKGAVKFENQAQFHPKKFLLAIVDKMTKLGVQIYENSRVVELDKHVLDSYTLTTKNGNKINAKKVIIASHYPFINKPGMYFSKIYAERAYAIAIKAQEKFPGGMYLSAEEPTRSFRGLDTEDGELILLVGENHKTGQSDETTKHYRALLFTANEMFTVEDVPYWWSTQDCMTMDDIPYIGEFHQEYKDLYVATGFKKWGMTHSMVSSILLKDMIISGKSKWQDVYNPSRKINMQGAKELIKENANVASNLVGGKLEKGNDELYIKPGEAQLINIEGNRAGAYKDENGDLHIVNTTCTHMGCELNWNEAEKSWDCPCHGSRFNMDGKVIEGPAVEDLTFSNDVSTFKKVLTEKF
ncbi:FAD-dependent oxidoreductase [Tissierella sp. Yu-01]|uniref:FAD-dependent oxidoreductase n=1 Tax=Tissierella sp. Yu-01 TaxID=3035694 RepID=UPI00240DD566|nr:FAD-dependent oxidoreductase [Tissierella sp. Yu-01]WFA07971.1 FAD-dependent oxidoreductase [Tissierella sp. Yu-01]